MTETIMEYLQRNLRSAGSSRWEAIAAAAGVSKSLPRKVVYERKKAGPGILTVQPLIDFFRAVDRGEKSLPDAPETTGHVRAEAPVASDSRKAERRQLHNMSHPAPDVHEQRSGKDRRERVS